MKQSRRELGFIQYSGKKQPMRRDELAELHYITLIANVPSIFRLGLLSHRRAGTLRHETVAMPEIQARRARVMVPGGRFLHEYVNLYIHARNPMLYKRKDQHQKLCVPRINPSVLDLPNVVVTDQNASSDYVRFAPTPDGLEIVDGGLVFAEYWTHPEDPIQEMRHKSIRCAEVLVPDQIPPTYIIGAYTSGLPAQQALVVAAPRLAVEVNAYLFFQGRR